ncbi:MAG TPA: hypothetical protein VGI54_01635 [Solirubrobacteraceae bacterium]
MIGTAVPPGFLGLSVETWALDSGGGLGAPPALLARFLRPLASGGGPAVLRVGGNSTDTTWWPSRGEPIPPWTQSSLTPAAVRRLRNITRASGSPLVVGLNMAADDPALAAREAVGIARGLRPLSVRAFELGNEPDLYTGRAWYEQPTPTGVEPTPARSVYGFPDFVVDWTRFAAAVRARVPGARFAAPGTTTDQWASYLPAFLAATRGSVAEVTLHRYPLRGCGLPPRSPQYPSIAHLLSDNASHGMAERIAPAVAAARAAGLGLRVGEMNSVACAGRAGVSNTFAASLWGLDTLFELVGTGVAGVNIHSRAISRYSPLTFVRAPAGWTVQVAPLYYALLLFAELTPRGTTVAPVAVPGRADVKVWLLRGPGARRSVVVIDKDPRLRGAVRLAIPGERAPAPTIRFDDSSVRSTTPPDLAGQSFGLVNTDGRLHGEPVVTQVTPDAQGTYRVPFTRPGVAVLSLVG